MRVVLMGPPNAGKGTQAQILQAELQVPKLSTGDMLRQEIATGSVLGKQAKELIDKGDLVPDEMIIAIISSRLAQPDCQHGFILDGFPRTVAQAERLDTLLAAQKLSLDLVVGLAVDDATIIDRVTGRYHAPTSGRVYHVKYNPPKIPGQCDVTGEALIHRADDRAEVVRHRLEVYRAETAPVLAYYAQHGRLVEIDGTQPIEQVHGTLTQALQAAAAKRQKKVHHG